MDWIRRNWPDLLIGLALLAVIAGIIATLLNGGSFLPGRTSAPTPPAATQTAQPNAADPNMPGSSTPQPDASGSGTPQGENTNPSAVADETPAVAETAATTDIPVIPSNSEGASAEAEDSAPVANITTTSLTESPAVAEPASPADTDAATSAAPSSAPSAATASAVESSYRIVVGSFGNPDNALRRAREFEDANLPAFTATQGDLNLVLVGPFATRAEADSALGRIQNEGLEANPLLFEPATSASATETAATEAAPSEAVTPTPTPTAVGGEGPSEASGASYLQTGAYGSSASALPQRERLEGLGFNVSEVQEGSFVKLLVGPFSDDELGAARSRLSDQGIDYFVRSN
ncbi:hypothetical protein BH24DEI2_BH24DEI2_01080 [soil metagenome]